MDIIQIPIHLIDEDEDQPRYQFDEEALQELAKSIEEIGLLSPIKVRTTAGGRYTIIYGNRRYKASQMLGKPSMPCIVSSATDEMEIYLEQIAENLTREGFSPIEEAEAFHKLMHESKFNSSIKYLANKLGKPESYIKNKCELLKFGNAVRKLIVSGTEIREGKLTEDQLLPIKDLPFEHRDPLALIIARDALPVSDVKKIAKLFKDKEISSGTKDKLLYKSGYELLQTWSTVQQNKAERERAAELKAEQAERAAAAKAEKARLAAEAAEREAAAGVAGGGTASGASEASASSASLSGDGSGASGAALSGLGAGSASSNDASRVSGVGASNASSVSGVGTSGASGVSGVNLLGELQQLLGALPALSAAPAELLAGVTQAEELQAVITNVDLLLSTLEQRSAELQTVRDLAATRVNE
ncbi:ParB/RepB/Spo0J family partition protein [Paenibacillus sp. OV219]|uniref:ParB/RepB/Spo0J family partition protein n=1 Tax=Paenibacillus sp. OV219 TaxID=1884377 RepID=UPI0008C43F69|nr:ParB/RepB/Spo0J family partition protein [Paenibacillus sp. OV219]SEO75059.1 chromosome partitioning protein, ParB family [Paenibacillus sp. OV219]